MKNHGTFNVKIQYYQGLCLLRQTTYANNERIALQFISVPSGQPGDEFPEPVATCTVNLPDERLEPGEVLIKSWGKNEGMEEFLRHQGIIGPRKREVPTGSVVATVHDLLI